MAAPYRLQGGLCNARHGMRALSMITLLHELGADFSRPGTPPATLPEVWRAGLRDSDRLGRVLSRRAPSGAGAMQAGVPKANVVPQVEGTRSDDKNVAATAAAKASGTNRPAVERQKALRKKRPDLAAKVRSGEMKPSQAMRQMKHDELAAPGSYLNTSSTTTQHRRPFALGTANILRCSRVRGC